MMLYTKMNFQRNNVMKTTLAKWEEELLKGLSTMLGETQNHLFIKTV